MLRGGAGSAFAPNRNGAASPTTLQKEAMERPSAWARDEDLEEGRRMHDARAVSTPCSDLSVAGLLARFAAAATAHGKAGAALSCMPMHAHARRPCCTAAPLNKLSFAGQAACGCRDRRLSPCSLWLPQKVGWWATASLGYKAIGIIFGDIGTSPLYTYANVFQTPPSHAELLGATSMIFWTITLVVLLKCARARPRPPDARPAPALPIAPLQSSLAAAAAAHVRAPEQGDVCACCKRSQNVLGVPRVHVCHVRQLAFGHIHEVDNSSCVYTCS